MRRDILRETQTYRIYCKPLSLKKTKKFTTACLRFFSTFSEDIGDGI
jgi:hypothetical protein